MFLQRAILIIAVAMLTHAPAQISSDIRREASNLDDLVNTGRYVEATKLTKSILDRLHVWQRDDAALVFLAYLGKAAVEQGQPRLALQIFNSAEALKLRTWDRYYEPALAREKAALSYAAGEYGVAAELAARAYRISVDHNYYRIRAEYCHSLQALALLRMGSLTDAERLASTAAKAVGKKHPNHPVFAPRILYVACVVTAQSGKFADAEAFCRRGLDASSASNRETRDVSLGHLAFAEYWLRAGDLIRSRESALTAVELTKRLFGTHHQDMVQALVLLASIETKEGNSEAARSRVNEAVKIASAMFGEESAAATLPTSALSVDGKKSP